MKKIIKTLSISLLFISVTKAFAEMKTQTINATPAASTPSNEDKNTKNDMVNLDDFTTNEPSSTDLIFEQQKKVYQYKNVVSLFKPNYILPFYYTHNPYDSIYAGHTPDNQTLKKDEFKGQISLFLPIAHDILNITDLSFSAAYTQIMYWQFYTKSQYFRETNYEPYLFLKYRIHRNIFADFGVAHQSNGRGGDLERSWNRIIGTVEYTGKNWYTQFTLWTLVFQSESSDLHNPDIAHYLGRSFVVLSYKLSNFVLSLEMQNLESLLKRGHVMVTASYPVNNQVGLFLQYFSGYGQSQIEYNHRTQSAGIGMAFNDWQ